MQRSSSRTETLHGWTSIHADTAAS